MSHTHESSPLAPQLTRVSLTLTACLIMTSCSNFSATDLAKKSVKSVKSISSNIIPSRVPIATVRAQDLQEMPTGADRALAWERHLNSQRFASNSRSWFSPKNYKAPTLPDERSLPTDGGLLPPLNPGQGSSLDGGGSLPEL